MKMKNLRHRCHGIDISGSAIDIRLMILNIILWENRFPDELYLISDKSHAIHSLRSKAREFPGLCVGHGRETAGHRRWNSHRQRHTKECTFS